MKLFFYFNILGIIISPPPQSQGMRIPKVHDLKAKHHSSNGNFSWIYVNHPNYAHKPLKARTIFKHHCTSPSLDSIKCIQWFMVENEMSKGKYQSLNCNLIISDIMGLDIIDPSSKIFKGNDIADIFVLIILLIKLDCF